MPEVKKLTCVVGLMAYNEEANIAHALRSVLSQKGAPVDILCVLVVASGCTDRTVAEAKRTAASDPRFRIVEEPERSGKARAVARFLAEAPPADVAVLTGADTRLEPGALAALLAPFADDSVGMVGGRPVPVNPTDTLLGRVVHLQWDLHHRVALRSPKLGELVAFRPSIPAIPEDTAVDEAAIEHLILARGLRLAYAPEAVVRMRGPSTCREYITQRRRIHAGHRRLLRETGHRVSTFSLASALSAASSPGREPGMGFGVHIAAAVLELCARLLGFWDDRVARRSHVVWERISSTKDLTP